MLAIGSKHAKQEGVKLARDYNNNEDIYFVRDEPLPCQKLTCADPLQLIDDDVMLSVFKRYSLSKKEIRTLLDFYRSPDAESMTFDSWKQQQAFAKLESHMINALKTVYVNPTAQLDVHYDRMNMRGQCFVGGSNSGKTYAMCKILLRPEFRKTKVYVFTPNVDDPSIQMLKERPRKNTIFVDLEKINSELRLNDAVSADSILVFDDIFEIRRDSPKRKILIDLLNETLSRGRHHKTKGGPGCSAMVAAHQFKSGHDSRVLWNECHFMHVYPSSSPHKLKAFLVKTLGVHKQDVNRILDLAEGRRITFRISGRPMFACAENMIYLL